MKPRAPSPSASKPSSSTQNTDSKQKMVSITPFSPFAGSIPSNLPIQNRFAQLGNPSSQSQTYSQLIQNPVVYSLSTPSKTNTLVSLGSPRFVSTPPSTASNASYVSNPNELFVSILENEEVKCLKQSIQNLVEFMFPYESLYVGHKPRSYYEAILMDTRSANITHIRNQNSNRQIDYSKIQIFKILSLSDWQTKPHTDKTLSNYPQYPRFNYYDYRDAWYHVFYLRSSSHSWFVFFDKTFDFNHGYPEWIVTWFKHLGTLVNVLPKSVQDGFKKFQELFPQEIQHHEYLLQFTMLFKIPWILSWRFNVKNEQDSSGATKAHLYRIMSVKWWEKLPSQQVSKMTIQGVVEFFSGSTGFGVQSQLDPLPTQLATQDEEEELRLLMSAPTKEELRRLYHEIKRSAAQKSPSSSASDQGQTPKLSQDSNLFQDSQDPYQEFSPYN